jgi:DNA (cytosine-5)-methyltransferase 1
VAFSLGLERTGGFETVAFCEIEPFPRRVLAKHWPGVPIYDDVRTLTADTLRRDGITVDAICGGFPCQDISVTGKGAGIEGERSGLWAEYARLIGELRPEIVIVENVSALLGRGLDVVLGDLAALGFDAEWHCLPAAYVGAPHRRDRLWVVAYPSGEGLERHGRSGEGRRTCSARLHLAPIYSGDVWRDRPADILRMDDGLPDRVGRISGAGNAVVPQVVELIGNAILASLKEDAA